MSSVCFATPSGQWAIAIPIDIGPSRGTEWYWWWLDKDQHLIGEPHGPLQSFDDVKEDANR